MNPDSFPFFVGEENQDGTFVACRTTEPVFCIHRETEEEAVEAARAVIDDYVERFPRPEPRGRDGRAAPADVPVWLIQNQKVVSPKKRVA